MSARTEEPAIVAAVEVPYRRHPDSSATTAGVLGAAVGAAARAAGVRLADVDGLAVSSFSLGPDHAIDLAWRVGLSLRWLLQDSNGGASGLNMLGEAVRAVAAGDASVVVVVAGDVQRPDEVAARQAAFNRATRDHLSPLGYGGPNSLFAMLTLRQMRAYGLVAEHYGQIAVSQRWWAGRNPGAVYRAPLRLNEYLRAPIVADPLRRYDCVPSVSGANAVVVASAARCRTRRAPVRVRSMVRSFNHDNQLGDGLRTGLAHCAHKLWDDAGVGASDVQLAAIYDDYPAMVLAQSFDLGLVPDGDLLRFIGHTVARRVLPMNTSGGLLSAGQAGAGGGMHGLVEAVRQLQHSVGERQVVNARLAVVTGYGMVLYRYGAAAVAAVLERIE